MQKILKSSARKEMEKRSGIRMHVSGNAGETQEKNRYHPPDAAKKENNENGQKTETRCRFPENRL
ncbi:MAG: hypothetical protein LIO63_03095 [Akkermansia sp.]|nr:hypothetical protein [Akkermansia sp.]